MVGDRCAVTMYTFMFIYLMYINRHERVFRWLCGFSLWCEFITCSL